MSLNCYLHSPTNFLSDWYPRVRGNFSGFSNAHKFPGSNLSRPCKSGVQAFARRKSVKKLANGGKPNSDVSSGTGKHLSEESNESVDRTEIKIGGVNDGSIISMPSRDSVLQACAVTSGLMAALALIIRQIWHLQLTAGLVALISSCRYLLLKTWPDFAESSEAANQQVLSSLQASDYLTVAFFPGISEELLFRGALLPLSGFDWKSVVAVSAIFGFLHLGSGRKYSFAFWRKAPGIHGALKPS